MTEANGTSCASAEQRQLAAAASMLISAHTGEICVVMSKSPAHKHFSLADIEWKVLPAVLSGQFHVMAVEDARYGVRAPVAAVTWAKVSAEVDGRLRQNLGHPVRLRPDEWTSGDVVWIVDIVGDPKALQEAFRELLTGPLRHQPAHLAIRGEDGAVKLDTLQRVAAT